MTLRLHPTPRLLALSLPLLAGLAQAACPSWPTTERFALSGAQVTDRRTGLVWARCSVGQAWNGSTCTGTASAMTHEAALAHAQGQGGWRLPNVKELASLADKGCLSPAIDTTAFPGTLSSWYWSSSPYAGYGSGAWFVYFGYGYVYSGNRNGNVAVRLVRASQ